MIVFGYEAAGPGEGLCLYRTIADLLPDLEETIDANSLFPVVLELEVHVIEMTEEEFAALPDFEY
jgi:hypothetical protein